MIILDTNVISELLQHVPNAVVASCIDQHPDDEIYITAITVAELLYGAARLPDGRRKQAFTTKVRKIINEGFEDQILPFDKEAATHYAHIYATRRRAGRPVGMADAQIAAVCRQFSAALVTRNVKDFEHTGVEVVNPWEPTPTSPG